MDQAQLVREYKENGKLEIQLPGEKVLKLVNPTNWTQEMGSDWIFLLHELFQIRTICKPFSEISLDIVEFASKPTIYHSPVNSLLDNAPVESGLIKFALIREPNWNKLLFQIGRPVLAKLIEGVTTGSQVQIPFPLQIKEVKELYLGTEGEVKIYKA